MQTNRYAHINIMPSHIYLAQKISSQWLIFSAIFGALSLLSTESFAQASKVSEAPDAISSIDSIDSISSDRPGFVESSTVLKPGRFQFESGVGFAKSKQDGGRALSTKLPYLIRYGNLDNLELRLESDGWTQIRMHQYQQATTHQRSYADLAIGLKWHMQDGDEITDKPAVAWLANLDLATGSGAMRGSGARPSLRMVAEWELAQDFTFALMPGWSWEKNDAGKRFSKGLLGFSLSHAMNDDWNVYIELSGEQLAAKHNGGSIVSYGAGVSHIVTPDVQVDFSLTKLWSGNAPTLQAGLGFSLRF